MILCVTNASFLASLRMFSCSSTAGSQAVLMISGRAWGSYPIIRYNGDFLVEEWG